jgi:hypothetical protein
VSERYRPRKLVRERVEAIRKGAAVDSAHPAPENARVDALSDLLCRLHGAPWRQCSLCSRGK